MTTLLPRLPGPSAENLLDRVLADDGFTWSGFRPDTQPQEIRFAATGGSVAEPRQLRELRDGIVAVASRYGFGQGGKDLARFDAAMSAWLADLDMLDSGEALRDDVWSYIGVVLAPDVVYWRFGRSRERYLGGIRNTFQRLWLRARVLDRGAEIEERWALVEQLTEDALVQITERPSIGADPVLARQVAEAWVRAASRYGRGRMEAVMRLATLRVRIRNEISNLSGLPAAVLGQILDGFFQEAFEALEPGASTQLTNDQASAGSSTFASAEKSPVPDPSRTRRRSWAIWRAR